MGFTAGKASLVGFLAALFWSACCAGAEVAATRVVVSVPGPHSLSYLAVNLIPRIGADRAEDLEVRLLDTGGGGVALSNLMNRNADFAVAGLPAAMSLRAKGGSVVGIAAVNAMPQFVLMVRADLKGKIKRIADLKGRVVGVYTSSLSSKTASQQLAELLLRSDGVKPEMVRILPVGQSWVEQSSVINSGAVDAIMGIEPSASRLLRENKVFFLANLADPGTATRIPGAGFLHATLATRADVLASDPAKAEKMVRALRRSLAWIADHSAEEVVAKLGIADLVEHESLVLSLKKYPQIFSKDGSFSSRQLADTETFFHAGAKDDPAAQALKVESMIVDRWVGRSK